MSTSFFDVKCEVKVNKKGECLLTISVGGVSMEEARQIAERTREPFRLIILDVLQAKELGAVDLLQPLQ